MHTFLEIDRIKYFYLVVILQQSVSALDRNTSFWISDHIRAVHLHQVGFQPEAGLTGTGAANHQYIFVSGSLGVLGAAVHGQALRFRQNHIVLKYRINVRCNILTGSP